MPAIKRNVFNRKFLVGKVSNKQKLKIMKCKNLHNKLIFYLAGDLPENENREVEHHLSECETCNAFADDMRKTLGIIELEKSPESNPFFYTCLKAKLEKAEEENQLVRRPVLIRVLQPVFFSIILFLGVYAGIKLGQPAESNLVDYTYPDEQVIPYLNEMEAEPIEAFLME